MIRQVLGQRDKSVPTAGSCRATTTRKTIPRKRPQQAGGLMIFVTRNLTRYAQELEPREHSVFVGTLFNVVCMSDDEQ